MAQILFVDDKSLLARCKSLAIFVFAYIVSLIKNDQSTSKMCYEKRPLGSEQGLVKQAYRVSAQRFHQLIKPNQFIIMPFNWLK